jgi:Ca-activated chloride channel family protein
LFLAGLAVGIFALSRPQATVVLPSNRGTVILALDISGSMRARDIKPSRIEAAKAAARSFIEKQPRSVRVGIVAFSATAALVQAPTLMRDDLYAAIDRLQPQRGTAIGSAILVALDAIFEEAGKTGEGAVQPSSTDIQASPDSHLPADQGLVPGSDTQAPSPVAPGSYTTAAIVLLTDGQSNTGPDSLDAAEKAANRGIRVFTVGVGTAHGDIVGAEGRSYRVSLDEDILKKIAQNTAASFYKASDEGQLMQIYRALSGRLVMGKETTEVTVLFAALAFAVVLIGALLSLLWFSKLV